MKTAAAVLVATMVLLAGCSGGGGTATPTESDGVGTTDNVATPASDTPASDTPTSGSSVDETPTDGPDDSSDGQQPDASAILSDINNSSPLERANELDLTLFNGSERIEVLVRNDTTAGSQLLRLSSQAGATSTYYNTTDYAALRNSSSGDVQYAEPGGGLGFGVVFGSAIILAVGVSYAGIVEWEQGGPTTVDGGSGYVYEATSLNETALSSDENFDLGFERTELQSVDGEMIVDSEGQVRSITVQLQTPDGTFGSELAAEYSEITIQTPDWVDESQAP